MKTKSGDVFQFSPRESKIIEIIGRKALTLREISLELFKDEMRGFDSSIATGNSIIRIIKKCKFYNLNWTYEKTKRDKVLIIRRVKR